MDQFDDSFEQPKKKKLFTVYVNGQFPMCIEIDEDQDPFDDFLSVFASPFKAIYDTASKTINYLFSSKQKNQLPESKLELLLDSAKCSVCGNGFDNDFNGNYLYCRDCKAPYHNDCWDYMGNKCSIYGCGKND